MMKKIRHALFSLLALTLLLTACAGEPTPFTSEILSNLNCQTGDLHKNQTYQEIEGKTPPERIFVSSPPIASSTIAYNEISSTHQSFSCSLFAFGDEDTAQLAYQRACNELLLPYHYPRIGEQVACQGGEGEVVLAYYKGTVLVWVWADYNGEGIVDVARRLEERLK